MMTHRFLPLLLILATIGCQGGIGKTDLNNNPSPDATGDDQVDVTVEDVTKDEDEQPDVVKDTTDPVDETPDVSEPPAFTAVAPQSYARRVKLLLHGGALTDSELAAARDSDAAFKAQVRQWVESPEFSQKMFVFLETTLQQNYHDGGSLHALIVSQLRGNDNSGSFRPDQMVHQNLREMFARTALRIVEQDRPFHEIATTNKWMMTTAMAGFLLAADIVPTSEGGEVHTFYGDESTSVDTSVFNASTPYATQLAQRTWYISGLNVNGRGVCKETIQATQQAGVYGYLYGSKYCTTKRYDGPIKPEDFTQWSEVEMVPLPEGQTNPVQYFDIPSVRQATHTDKRIALTLPRTGFYMSPSYLARWRSNKDNDFRVTTNQTLIVGLGNSFEPENFTVPLTQEGLDEQHAVEGTVCYGCHIDLDPMRNYFARHFNPDFYSLAPPEERTTDAPSFGFLGHNFNADDSLAGLGKAVASHPLFAQGWVQKMCAWANSRDCDTDDPEFQRVVALFQQNYSFKDMVVELFSSPLITSATRTKTHEADQYLASITRRHHLCQALNVRLKQSSADFEVCDSAISEAIPDDDWSRGSTEAFQPARSSLFFSSTVDAYCRAMSSKFVDDAGEPALDHTSASYVQDAGAFVVQTVMGVPSGDSRYAALLQVVSDHIVEVEATEDLNAKDAVKSALALGCASPLVSSIDF